MTATDNRNGSCAAAAEQRRGLLVDLESLTQFVFESDVKELNKLGHHDVDPKFAGSLEETSFEIQRKNVDRELPSGAPESTEPTALRTLMDDVAILHLLGLKLILVAGIREKVLDRLSAEGLQLRLHKGMQVTDRKVLQFGKEESGVARFEIESALAKAFWGMFTQRSTTLVSGNSFYSAKPLG
eukprot:gene23027-24360_t